MFKFLRTTLVGGFLFLLPIGIIVFFAAKIVSAARGVLESVSRKLPFEAVGGVSATLVLAVAAIVIVSFLAGFLAKTGPARLITRHLEERLLSRVPAYGLIRSMGTELVGQDEAQKYPVVLVSFDDARQLAIKMGETAGGREVIVFVPDSPTPQTGAAMIVEAHRVTLTDMPVSKAFVALSSRGAGLEEHLPPIPLSSSSMR
jgi:uncharacterized membrane protein